VQGGHGVPTPDLIRRYDRSFENLMLALPLCEKIQIYDNSAYLDVLTPLLIVKNGKVVIWDKNTPQYLKNVLQGYVLQLQNSQK